MDGPIKVFVSATSRDLRSVRAKVAARLRERGHTTVEQPAFETDHRTICAMLLDKITPCHAVVHIAGFVYGAEPRQRPADALPRSYTQLEYEMGIELKKPVFVFLATPDFPFDTHTLDPADLRQRQIEHRTRLESGDRIWYTVATEAELLGRVDKIDFLNRPEPRPRKPNNLPYESLGDLFKGRDEFVTRLRTTLVARPAHAAVVAAKQAIHGLGGVGKTRLAIEYGWRFQDQYCALLFVSADSPEGLRRGLAALCRAEILNLPERDAREEAEQVAAAVRWLGGHPGWFLVLDNADTPKAATAVEQLLPRVDGGHVVITSRIAEWETSGAVAMELDVLDTRPATDFLLARTAGKRRTTPTDDADALSLATDLDGLALALEQAGAFIAKHRCSVTDYRTRWGAQEPKVLEWFDARAMKYPKSVAVTWQTSIDQLTDDGRALLNVLAWLAPDPIPVDMILKKPGDEERSAMAFDAESGLADLGSYSLVKWEIDGNSAVVHRLVQEVTQYRTPETNRRGWIETALRVVHQFAPAAGDDVRTWGVWNAIHPHAEKVTVLAYGVGIDQPTSQMMNQLALYLSGRAAYADAEVILRRALAIDEHIYGPDDAKISISLNNLASILTDTNRLDEAETLMRRSLAIEEHNSGRDHPQVAIALNNLAKPLHLKNDLEKAEPLMRRALAIDESRFGPDHPFVARDLTFLTSLLLQTVRLKEAEPLILRAVGIFERSFGVHHPNVANALSNLADLLQATNRLTEAEPVMHRILEIYEDSFGADHPHVAIALSNLAQLLQATNRLEEAEPMIRRALAIFEQSYGFDHPHVANALNNLAQLLDATNRLEEAEPMMRRALAINEQSYGLDHPDVAINLNNLAKLFQATNRLEEAEPLMRRALAIDENSYGPEHPDVARDLSILALLLQAKLQHANAEPLYQRALRIWHGFRLQTGHIHPNFNSGLSGYRELLNIIGFSESEIEAKIRTLLDLPSDS